MSSCPRCAELISSPNWGEDWPASCPECGLAVEWEAEQDGEDWHPYCCPAERHGIRVRGEGLTLLGLIAAVRAAPPSVERALAAGALKGRALMHSWDEPTGLELTGDALTVGDLKLIDTLLSLTEVSS